MSLEGSKLTLIARVFFAGLISFLVLYPVGMLIFGSFRTDMPGLPASFSFQGYIEVYTNPNTYKVIWTTIKIAVMTTLSGVGLTVFFAWLIHRTNMPGRRFLDSMLYLAYFLLPPLPVLLGWILLFAPRSGIINKYFYTMLDGPLFNLFSLYGIVFASLSFLVPLFYFFLAPAFMNMDTTLEEAASASGASGLTVVRKVTMPLLAPAILATMVLAFTLSMQLFEAPALLGIPANISVLSTKLWQFVTWEPPQYPPAMALGIAILVVASFLVLVQWRVLGKRQFTTVTGKGYRPRPMDLGVWRWPAFLLGLFIFLLLTGAPMLVMVQTSFMKVAGIYMEDMYTLDNYKSAFTKPEIWLAVKNTVILAVVSATACMTLCFFLGYMVAKTKFKERKILDFITWISWGTPPIVLGLGLLWAYILLPLPFGYSLYGTLPLLILAIIFVGLPIGTRIMVPTMMQVSDELEESAIAHGATWVQTIRRIWFPLLKGSLINGWLLIFCFAVKDVSTVILLYSPDSVVISTQFFHFVKGGSYEVAAVVGLMQTALMLMAFFLMKTLGSLGGIKKMEK